MYKRYSLSNGLRIIYEEIPYVKSVAVGVFVLCGSRFETEENNGVSHFIEHLLFKGTKKRTALDIAEEMDCIGGQLNAFTSQECTCYYAKSLSNHLDLLIDILSDMYHEPKMNVNDIELERKVILEEISMYQDSPEDLVHEVMQQNAWKGNSLGLSISGTPESVRRLTRDSILSHKLGFYVPEKTVISISGNFDEMLLLELLEKHFAAFVGKTGNKGIGDRTKIYSWDCANPVFTPAFESRTKDIEQAHVCMGFNGVPGGSKEVFDLAVLNNIFGSSMSSRLFQKIREEKGLVYSIYGNQETYKDAGVFSIYAGTSGDRLALVIELMLSEINNLLKNSVTDAEIYRGREQLKSNYLMGLESVGSRMIGMGKNELIYGRVRTQEEIITLIDAVNKESILKLAEKILNVDMRCQVIITGKS